MRKYAQYANDPGFPAILFPSLTYLESKQVRTG